MNMVDHPQHYNQEGKKECIVEMEEKFGTRAVITFCQLNAYKYRYRAELKGAYQQDLEKAKWYDNYAHKLQDKLLKPFKQDEECILSSCDDFEKENNK